nr:hypothetical protein [Tanacetum cinerariifolium]
MGASEGSTKKKGRTSAVTTKDIQKRRNNVKARTTLLLALLDEHQLRFSKYKTAQELWAAILKTFGGNEASKKTKKNLLKQQYGSFKAIGKETLDQTFNRLQAIVIHMEFMDVSDLDTTSLDDLYNHLKVYEPEVQKKSDSQNMAFISSAKNISRNGEVNTASIPTSSTQVSPASANVVAASISLDNACAYIASQSNGSQLKADRYWKKTGKKISIQGTNVASFDKSKVECFNCHKMGHFARECRAPKSHDRDRRENFKQEENNALVADEEAPTEFALMAKSSSDNEVKARLVEFKNQEIKFYKKIRGLEFKDESKTNRIENLTNEQEMLKKEKEGLHSKLTVMFPLPAQVYSPPKKDMSWTGLPEFADDTITDYTRPSFSIEGNPNDLQNNSSFGSKNEESTSSILSKPEIKFVKAADSTTVIKTNKDETVRKPSARYAEMYRKSSKGSIVRGNQRNWNNLKSQQLSKNFLMKNKACFNCGDFDHLSYDCVRTQVRVPRVLRVPTVNRKFPTVNRKFPTGNLKVSTADFGNKRKAVKASNNIDDKGYWDSGCSQHMTGNISYLTNYEPFDEGYVSFGQGGCKITSKGTIKTDLTCLVAKAFADECMLWHRRLGHLNFKTMNMLVRHNLVKGLPSKCVENDHTCAACLKGKQHKASCKTKLVNSVTKPLHTLHMDLFGPTSVSSLNHKWYCLVVTDDFTRFTWTFFLKTKDETSGILRNFIIEIENLKDLKVKIIRCDNRGEFRNKEMNDFCSRKGIKREFSNARTPQQNRVAERRNRTLIEADRTMLADAKLPVTFWAEAVNTACYVQNRVLDKPFGCHVMILNTLDHLGKFEAKGDEDFLENKLTEKGVGPNWLFDIDTLTNSMNYVPVVSAGTTSTNFLGTKEAASQDVKKDVSSLRYIALLNWFHEEHLETSTSNAQDACKADAPESSGNFNPTATSTNPSTDQMETLTVETPILTIRVRPIGTKWVLKNKKDERGIVIRNKSRLVAQGHTQEEGFDYKEFFALVDPEFPARVYKVEKAMYGLHQAPRAWYDDIIFGSSNLLLCREFEALMHEKFQMSAMGELNFFLGLHVLQKKDGIFLSQDKYVGDILTKFGYSNVRSANTPMDKENPWGKDETGKDVDLHLYRSMIGSLMYLTTSRPDIMFAVCACARHQVTPKEYRLHAIKRTFRYLKGHPKLGLWYPKESPFDLVAYSDSDYGGATQDRKSTTGGCQFLGRRLISWQCKKHIIVEQVMRGSVKGNYIIYTTFVKNKREKDKIKTKPNQIKKKGKRRKDRKCRRPITVKKAEKEVKIQIKWTNYANPEDVLKSK